MKQMAQKHMRVSLVIPAYNEEHHLKACLDCIAAQLVMPYEVILVDNNSTDQTIAIARSYPFVRVVSESRQGIVFARDCGFNAAAGDIIGRIDVETLMSEDWVQRIQTIFTDPKIDAVSGTLTFYDVPFRDFFDGIDYFFRCYLARNLAKHRQLFLYGSNMAIRRSTWQSICPQLCRDLRNHEDLDLAAHMAGGACNVAFDKELCVAVSARRVDNDFHTYYNYVMANSRTYLRHKLKGRFYMYPIIWLVIIFYLPIRLLYRSYDPSKHCFSFKLLLEPPYKQRVSPITE